MIMCPATPNGKGIQCRFLSWLFNGIASLFKGGNCIISTAQVVTLVIDNSPIHPLYIYLRFECAILLGTVQF